MRFKFFDGIIKNFPELNTFRERLGFLNDEIFNPIIKPEDNEEVIEQKTSYKKYYNSHTFEITNALKYLTTYLLGAKNYSVKHCISRYIDLKKKYKNKTITAQEKIELNELKKSVIYDDKKLVFFENVAMEQQLKNALVRLKDKKDKDYSENFMFDYIGNSIQNIKKCKVEVREHQNKIKKITNEIKKIKHIISNDYETYKETKDKSFLTNVDGLIKEINKNKEDIINYKNKIKILCDDYLLDTELQYKTIN